MSDPSTQLQLTKMIAGSWISQAIYAAAKFGIADLLSDGPQTAVQLAQATNTKHDFLFRVLRALASVGVFAEDGQGRFSLTPMAELLRSDVPGSQRSLAIMMGEEHFIVWADLAETLRTGGNAFEKRYGMPVFDFLGKHPEQAKIFDEAMTGIHGVETQAVLDAYDFSSIGVLADVGGGNGSNLIAILQKYPAMRGMLFDLPHVIERARTHFEAAGLLDRCQLISGSFFESVPQGADAYLMRHIIHDWDDEKATTILKHCRSAISNDGKLLLVESVIPPGNDPFFGKFLDVTMFLIPGGKERTEAEYRQLFAGAGFHLDRIVPTKSEMSVIEGRGR
jgi:hypothetical protein